MLEPIYNALGQEVSLTDEQHASLLHPPGETPAGTGGTPVPPGIGLGDAVHKVLGPIGKAINWPCLKGNGTTDLKAGSPCDKVKNLLNKI